MNYSWKNVIVSGMGVFTDGYNLYSISLASYFIVLSLSLTKLELGVMIAGSYYGAAVAAIAFGFLADRLGRKKLYGIDVTLAGIGAIAQAFSQNFPELLVSRLILGMGIGADYVLSPIIVAENVPAKSRGKMMVITFAVMWGLGAVLAAFVEQVALMAHLPYDVVWRLVLGFGAVPALSVVVLRRKIYETLMFLSRVKPVKEELRRVERELGQTVKVEKDMLPFAKRLASSMAFIVASAVLWLLYDIYSSTFAIYGPITIAQNLGLSPIAFTYVAQFFAGIPGQLICIALIDRIGRRPLIVTGYAGVSLWLFMYALLLLNPRLFGVSLHNGELVGFGAELGFTFYLLNYLFSAMGPASIIGSAMVTPELVPTKVRGTGQSITVGVDRLAAALNISAFPELVSSLGLGWMVGIFAGIALLSSIITILFIPEMKEKPLEVWESAQNKQGA
ncbi:MAG: major facilitator transporter [Candidatus Aramenus sulfurataquae]|jgi:MFS family permease|uniref:MFS transporter n=2 Tax=Candidatus Aramenus sulfurataquae TaxID=1326980 RepID=W7L4Q9_9CREN|nr:MAG: major facilitator transporter [Candidatus Aramenus sulfurataquae]MCL7343531.1 MFS transporter [Candidatus Aramenus sulfurataquae]